MEENKRAFSGKFTSLFALFSFFILLFLDQFTKHLAVTTLKSTPVKTVSFFKGLLHFTYLENKGSAWGMMSEFQIVVIIMTILLFLFLIYLFYKLPFSTRFLPARAAVVLLSAGAIGNLIDRIRFEYVVDFLEFEFISFPVFNVADIYVTVSSVFILILVLFVYKENDYAWAKKKQQ